MVLREIELLLRLRTLRGQLTGWGHPGAMLHSHRVVSFQHFHRTPHARRSSAGTATDATYCPKNIRPVTEILTGTMTPRFYRGDQQDVPTPYRLTRQVDRQPQYPLRSDAAPIRLAHNANVRIAQELP